MPPGAGSRRPAQRRRVDAAWSGGHDALAKLSTRGSNQVVPGAGHYIQVDQPGAVVDAVRKVVMLSRG